VWQLPILGLPDGGSYLVRGPDYPRQVPGPSGWLWGPHRHVCGRCAVNLAVRLGLAYACASTYTHSKAATDAETAPLVQLGTVKAGARERLRGLTVCNGLPIRKAWCFAYQVYALYKAFADTGCLYSEADPSAFLCILGVYWSLRPLLVKALRRSLKNCWKKS
jgi:hypothetical protein